MPLNNICFVSSPVYMPQIVRILLRDFLQFLLECARFEEILRKVQPPTGT